MDIPHGSEGTFPREGPWLGRTGLAAAGLMIGVAVGMSISPWTMPSQQQAAIPASPGLAPGAPVAAVSAAQTAPTPLVAPPTVAPAEVQGMEVCWGGIEPVSC